MTERELCFHGWDHPQTPCVWCVREERRVIDGVYAAMTAMEQMRDETGRPFAAQPALYGGRGNSSNE